MYILTGKYFPTDSWPDLYFPALLEASLVDIQYTEVMAFTVAACQVAEFDVVLPNNATVGDTTGIVLTGGVAQFGMLPNGTYSEYGTYGGRKRYRMATTGFSYDGYIYIVWAVDLSAPYSRWYISLKGTDSHTPLQINNDGIFYSNSDVTYPYQAVWVNGRYGTTAPVVSQSTPVLTEIAAFTVEMPQVINLSVYEELS